MLPKPPVKPRVLLLQVRELQAPAHHERLCFLERLDLPPSDLVSVNVVTDPVPSLAEASTFDLVMLGGAGRFSAYSNDPFTEGLLSLVTEVVEAGIPFFGSCYGHQFLARAFGARVVFDPEREEIGTHDIELTDEGAEDPLFSSFPRRFGVHLGHHDRVVDLPSRLVPLAHSRNCPNQLIRLRDRPAYGSQFHSEMTMSHLRERLLMYSDEYLHGETDGLDRLLRPTEVADGLLGALVDLYAGVHRPKNDSPTRGLRRATGSSW